MCVCECVKYILGLFACELLSKTEKQNQRKKEKRLSQDIIVNVRMLFNLTLHTCSPGVTLTELQKRGGMNDEAYAKVFSN